MKKLVKESLNENIHLDNEENEWAPFVNDKGYLKSSFWTIIRNNIKKVYPNDFVRIGIIMPKSLIMSNVVLAIGGDPLRFEFEDMTLWFGLYKREGISSLNSIKPIRDNVLLLKMGKGRDYAFKGNTIAEIDLVANPETVSNMIINELKKII